MNDMLSGDVPEDFERLVKLQYMSTVNAAADELGIKGISINLESPRTYELFERFMLQVIGIKTQIRLRSKRENDPNSVHLSARTRALIEREISRLRELIEGANLKS